MQCHHSSIIVLYAEAHRVRETDLVSELDAGPVGTGAARIFLDSKTAKCLPQTAQTPGAIPISTYCHYNNNNVLLIAMKGPVPERSARLRGTASSDNLCEGLKQGDLVCSFMDAPLVQFSSSGKIIKPKKLKSGSWKSENSLLTLFEPLDEPCKLSDSRLQDSGFRENTRPNGSGVSETTSMYLLSIPPPPVYTFGRRKSVSLQNIPIALNPATSMKSIAMTDSKKENSLNLESISSLELDDTVINLHAASLKSSKSMEMLTRRDVEAMTNNLHTDLSSMENAAAPSPEMAPISLQNAPGLHIPIVPKRRSAFLENCTVKDDYLIKQGKRLSGLPIDENPFEEERGHFNGLFKRVGNVLKKFGSSNSLTTTPSPIKGYISATSAAAPSPALCHSSHTSTVPLRRKSWKSLNDLGLVSRSCCDISSTANICQDKEASPSHTQHKYTEEGLAGNSDNHSLFKSVSVSALLKNAVVDYANRKSGGNSPPPLPPMVSPPIPPPPPPPTPADANKSSTQPTTFSFYSNPQ